MRSQRRKTRTVTALLLGGLFVISSLLSLGTGMAMTGTNQMTSCPLMIADGNTVVCPMSLLDHLAVWQSLFVAVTPSLQTLLGLVVLVVAILPWLKNTHVFSFLQNAQQRHTRRRTTEWIAVWADPLKQAFAQGILHGKRGELA